jgi:hypothetical protein
LEEFYAPLVVDDEAAGRGVADGSLVVDTRLRDVLRELDRGGSVDFGRLDVAGSALFAAESSALGESDLAATLGARVDSLDERLARLERGPGARVGRALRRGVRA